MGAIGDGFWPEWNPFAGGGLAMPVHAQYGLYSPLWWALGLLHLPGTLAVLTDVQVLHVLFGATGVLMLARARGLEWRWALVAALPFVFFGGFFGNAQHADLFRGFAYAPWLLWALTPPAEGVAWRRVLALPPLIWLMASTAYPGVLLGSLVVGVVYVGVDLCGRGGGRARVVVLGLCALAGLAAIGAIFLPYLDASGAGALYRPHPPTVQARAEWALHLEDVFGLYLDNFAWKAEGSANAWAIGVPALIGLAGLAWSDVRRQASLLAAGSTALALAMLPAWGPAGRLMLGVPVLFASRFSANDYKAMVAVAAVVLAAFGWRRLAAQRGRPSWLAAGAAALVLAGLLVAPSPFGELTVAPIALVAVVAVAALLAILGHRLPPRLAWLLPAALLALVFADGVRMAASYRHVSGVVPWAISPDDIGLSAVARDEGAVDLPTVLRNPPARRPARIAPVIQPWIFPDGIYGDTDGMYGIGYHLGDYGGTIPRQRLTAELDPALEAKMLAPWTAWSWPCARVACGADRVSLPDRDAWVADAHITTTAYSLTSITYRVDLDQPVLMVENELDIPGWSAGGGVRHVTTDGVLRSWILPAGRYSFTASFRQPERGSQEALGLLALLLWVGAWGISLRRRWWPGWRLPRPGQPRPPGRR